MPFEPTRSNGAVGLRRAALLLSSAMLAAATCAAPASAADPTTRFHQVSNAGQIIKPAMLPAGIGGARPVTVVVTMASDSVATARARTATLTLSDSEERAVVARSSVDHAALRPSIESRGGKVLASYHHALNGFKVEIDAREMAGLARLPGVVSVLKVPVHKLDNAVSVPYLGAPAVWQGVPGYRGEHVKVAIIDTGIDYTHANFGGPGTVDAYNAANANSSNPADPTLFGPNAPKVKGGIDLVGDAYDANVPGSVPVPDSNPLDCEGHGSHVAGTVAGFGVTKAGATYSGPYTAAIYGQQNFAIGPGVAPKADLYAVRVFGCAGSTNVVTDAIDWAVKNKMDVINMSLGSAFGTADAADSVAADNAARAGITVVVSAGNSGPAPYIVGSPGTGTRVITAAAMDSTSGFPGATITPASGPPIRVLDANGASVSASLGVVVLRNANGTVSLGCNAAEYVDAVIAGKLVVTQRGTCARVLRAQLGQAHGAAAVAMINNSAGYPVYEGDIPGVTIPFLGVLRSDSAALTGAASATVASGISIPNPGFETVASFSSGGPRYGDSLFKPSVSGPGVAILSTAVGTGTGGARFSGTSMAAPHVAGVAALTRQAHPRWSEREVAAALVETSNPGVLVGYSPRLAGAGVIQPIGATRTQAVALGEDGNAALSFGFAEFSRDFRDSRSISVRNHGRNPVTFDVTSTPVSGAPHSVQLSRTSVSLEAGEDADLNMTLQVPAATVGAADAGFQDVAGYLTLTPVGASANNGVSLTVPYYLVPRARSKVSAELADGLSPRHPASSVRLNNSGSTTAGNADFYAWGLYSAPQGLRYVDTRAVGVQSFAWSATQQLLVFAINTHTRFSNPAPNEWDLLIDTNGDGVPDYDVFAYDYGAVTTGSYSGQLGVFILDLKTGALRVRFSPLAPTDGSILLLPVLSSDIGLSAANPRFSYTEQTYDEFGNATAMPGVAAFNAFSPSISTGDYVTLLPGTNFSDPVGIDPVEWQLTPALGLMVVVDDNNAGASEAKLLRARGDN